MNPEQLYDVIIIGGGHAGAEAALASARLGARTLLLTHNIETVGQMSCNPAIGGLGKGHLVREIDALGGLMAQAADAAGIHFRILNSRKGPAVRATRAQADRALYRAAVRRAVENRPNLSIFQQAADDLILKQGRVVGVVTAMGLCLHATTVVLATGTFLGGRIYVGDSQHQGGRAGDPPSIRLAQRLRELPLTVDRLKTGTPPRIDGRSIDYRQLQEQPGDQPEPIFSLMGSREGHPRQVSCHITRTNPRTHDLIRQGLHRSPLYSGVIEGAGPRYCPSIEDKVVRFAERDSHQIFIEPEGLSTHEVYPNGISTSLPYDMQLALVRSIEGLENAHITRPGYAIEYDFFDPRDLRPSLETRAIPGLFFAGQINGTTGYEEAAAQGLVAGCNAARQSLDLEPWSPRRDQGYLGVMIDDLITQGAPEPYRMFTSRAEYRLLLREDNADLRLTQVGRELGLVSETQWRLFNQKREAIEAEQQRLAAIWLRPGEAMAEEVLGVPLNHETPALEMLRRPDVDYRQLMRWPGLGPGVTDATVAEQVQIQARYAGYIDRQQDEIRRNREHRLLQIPEELDYSHVAGLSAEVCEKLTRLRPVDLDRAAHIPGVTPASISVLRIHLKKHSQRPQRRVG